MASLQVFEYLLSKGADPWLMAQSSDGMVSAHEALLQIVWSTIIRHAAPESD